MANNLKPNILLHFGLSILLVILILSFTYLTEKIFTNIGYGLLTVLYILILIAQILYYFLTSYTKWGLTILSFVLNFIIWVAEQVNLERTFEYSAFYQDDDFGIKVTLLGGLLWATNKLLLDKLFEKFNLKMVTSNRLDNLWTNVTKKQSTNR